MKKINEKWKRKRLINITYLIKKILSEYDNSKAKKIKLHLSEKILNFYNDWYDDFKKIKRSYKDTFNNTFLIFSR